MYEQGDYAARRIPVVWELIFSGVPRKFTRHEKISARRWDTCPLGYLFPAVAERVIEQKQLSGKDKQLMALSLAFGCKVNSDDFENAEEIYQKLERENER